VNRRAVLLPVVAVLLVSAVLGVQLAHGGGDFTPARAADPCAARPVTTVSTGIDGLGERLVPIGLDEAACRLHVSREAFILDLAQPEKRTTAHLAALRAGLRAAVSRMKKLADEALDDADLPFLVKAGIRLLPDSVIDAGLKTDDVLRRTIDKLDLRKLLADMDDPDAISAQMRKAVNDAVKESLVARLRDLLP
jgi:hypothetical protein